MPLYFSVFKKFHNTFLVMLLKNRNKKLNFEAFLYFIYIIFISDFYFSVGSITKINHNFIKVANIIIFTLLKIISLQFFYCSTLPRNIFFRLPVYKPLQTQNKFLCLH